jgi:hypothetical protein
VPLCTVFDWLIGIEWIPGYLAESTQTALRTKMKEVPYGRDVGIVYACEIRGT